MQTVASGASAQDDDEIVDLRFGAVAADRQYAGAAAEDERVAQVAFVIEDGPVDSGQAELVAVVTYAGYYAGGDASRVEQPFGQLLVGVVLRAKAEHVGGGNGPGGYADDVAHDAADPGVGSAKRFQGGRDGCGSPP